MDWGAMSTVCGSLGMPCMSGLDDFDEPVGVAVLVVEPEDQLDRVLRQLAPRLGVHHHRVGLADKQGAGAVVFAHQHPVGHDPSEGWALARLAKLQAHVAIHRLRPLALLELNRQVEHGHVRRWLYCEQKEA